MVSTSIFCKRALTHQWNKENFGNLDKKIDEVQAQLQFNFSPRDNQMDSHVPNQLLLHSLLLKQEILWKQRAHDNHILLGDKNTKYFHNKDQRSRWRKKKLSS